MNQLDMTQKYIDLIKSFVSNVTDAEKFDSLYMDLGHKISGKSEKLYNITQELFYDVEEFCIDPELRDEGEIDEKGLLESATRTLKKLEEYKKELLEKNNN